MHQRKRGVYTILVRILTGSDELEHLNKAYMKGNIEKNLRERGLEAVILPYRKIS
jgi:hypothetical protein